MPGGRAHAARLPDAQIDIRLATVVPLRRKTIRKAVELIVVDRRFAGRYQQSDRK